jgi:hypothetical protein
MPELVLDCPMIHSYLWHNVVEPLIRKGKLKPRFIKWNVDQKEKQEEDDLGFDSTDGQIKLMALILSDFKKGDESTKNNPRPWDEVFKYYSTELKWEKMAAEKQAKIEDKEGLW